MSRFIYCLVCLLTISAAPAGAAGFDCAKAGTPVEQMVCADPALSKLDDQLTAAYKAALSTTGNAAELRRQQKEWLEHVRNRCATRDCLTGVYEQRLKALAVRAPAAAGGVKGEKETWLSSRLYGNDNDMAALREVRIWQDAGRYMVLIRNQFSFQCELTFNSNGQPARLARCASTLKPGDEWHSGGGWAVKEDEFALTCATLKSEVVCRGQYTLLPNASQEYMTIARKR